MANEQASQQSQSIQHLIDQAALFNLFAIPDPQHANAAIHISDDTKDVIGMRGSFALHRFVIDLQLPSLERGVKATNIVGQTVGRIDLRWMVIPYEFMALPNREPPPTRFDPTRSQRFVMQKGIFTFGTDRDGFHSFGTGRTFPMMVGGRPKLIAAAVGNITEGFGKFRGHEGNFTLCGDLSADNGFLGHIGVRVIDPDGHLRTKVQLPPIKPQANPDPGTTYLMWVGQKGKGPEQENRFSIAPDGGVRGLNIATESKLAQIDFAVDGPEGFRCTELRTGKVIGGEIGCGRAAKPGAPPTGTALSPFLFEGVAQYDFHDRGGREIGAITTNVLEGRRFDMKLSRAPAEPATRFGFFGPIVSGSGCFRGVEGILYGASASVFQLPPSIHVITHVYMGRLDDPDGKFRTVR